MCCDSQTCPEYSAGVATASDVEHFLGFKSLVPIAANVVLAPALLRTLCKLREERRFDHELGKLRRPPETLFRCAACKPTAACVCLDGLPCDVSCGAPIARHERYRQAGIPYRRRARAQLQSGCWRCAGCSHHAAQRRSLAAARAGITPCLSTDVWALTWRCFAGGG
ncbi:hypothetical protein T492DRAFT_394653 [Pavlovales sp. CCMP2436]|nr:hypothetical protein T492DRAFT_394653 [Pavlovales sp. CCMP2436]